MLIDQSGFFLNPLGRRTWAIKGRTPKLIGFGRHRDKVSTITAIAVTPNGRRIRLFWQTDAEHTSMPPGWWRSCESCSINSEGGSSWSGTAGAITRGR